jgi:hypothetical protein
MVPRIHNSIGVIKEAISFKTLIEKRSFIVDYIYEKKVTDYVKHDGLSE